MRTEIIMGIRLHQRADGWWIDDNGTIHDYRAGKLYEQRRPGVWFWIRGAPEKPSHERSTAVPRGEGDRLLDSLEANF